MTYCLIGCGRIANNHIAAAKNNNLQIAALCDIDPNAINKNIGATDAQVFEHYHDMLRVIKPELAAIATPSGLHAQMALDCLAAGAHVIIEKPIAMCMHDAKKIAEAAKKANLVAAVCLQNRFNPAVTALKKAVDAGRFGRIYGASMQLSWHRGQEYYDSAAWRGTLAQDGGVMMNQSIHGIDLLNWMMGSDPVEVTALTGTLARKIEAEDIGLALLRYPNGALANLSCTTLRYHGAEEQLLEINGETGFVRLGGTSAQMIDVWRFDDNNPGEEDRMRREFSTSPAHVYGHSHGLLYADVLHAITSQSRPFIDSTQGSKALRIILAAYESAKTGRSIAL